MPADLTTTNGFSRVSLIATEDALVVLEHEWRSDRVRKIPYARIESMLVWRKLPILWITLVSICFLLPAISLLFVDETAALFVALFLFMCGGTIVALFAYCRRTTIRIVCDGNSHDFPSITRPGKVDRFVSTMRRMIVYTQKSDAAEIVEILPEPQPETPTATPRDLEPDSDMNLPPSDIDDQQIKT